MHVPLRSHVTETITKNGSQQEASYLAVSVLLVGLRAVHRLLFPSRNGLLCILSCFPSLPVIRVPGLLT